MTKHYQLTGLLRWVKVWPDQIDRKFSTDSKGGNWSVIMTLDDKSVKLYNGLGLKNKAVSETDVAIFKLKKPDAKNIPEINDVILRRYERHPKLGDLGSPKVSGVENGTLIGNGSKGTCVIEVYPYTFEGQAGFACRLDAVEVLDCIPYVKDAGPDTEGTKDRLDDKIPF